MDKKAETVTKSLNANHDGEEQHSHPILKSGEKSDDINTTLDTESPSLSPLPSSASPSTSSPSPPGSKPVSRQAQVAIKILVTNNASGSIIGRGGKSITDLQEKSQTRIKLSQGGDYYPGTTDRVCLINGALSNVELAVELVLAKLYDIQRLQHMDVPFTVRILLPSSSCGMIIGHGGSNIKLLKEKSQVSYVQLSPKTAEVVLGGSVLSTSERVMTILGPFESCVTCIQVILNELAHHPEICRYLNMTTSYSKVVLSTFQASYNTYQIPTLMHQTPMYDSTTGFMPDQYGVINQGRAIGFHPYNDSMMSTSPQSLVSQTMMLSTSPPSTSQQGQFWPDASSRTPGGSGMPTVAQLAGSFQEQVALTDPPQHLSRSSVVEISMEIPDDMIGSILGHGGKYLNRIQTSTQTRIRLSQRGVFVPGTNHRLVIITGSSSENVEHARNLINERLPSSSQRRHSSALR
ncbi:hypothetical protein ACHAWC_004796 [Mediolabrus comicus]